MMMKLAFILSAAGLATVVYSDKDTNFYHDGFTNPNIENEMYWKDSVNVLQDLSQFSALYIKHHGCVHSSYYPAGYDGEGGAGRDHESYCGFDGGEEYWYLGVSPCFKANSVFSLYGILKSNPQGADSEGSYCHKATYIDTYFTRAGVETIGVPFGFIADGQDQGDGNYMASSYCVNDVDDGEGQQNGDDYVYNAEDHTSYGTGCYDKTYVYDCFEGSFCSAQKVKETIDYLDTFNTNMDSLTCTQIFDGSDYRDEDYNNDDDGDGDYLTDPLDILLFSHSCSVTIYPDDCIDPYGLKLNYAQALEKALANEQVTETFAVAFVSDTEMALKWTTWALFMVGFVLLGSTYYLRRKVSTTSKEKDDPVPSEVNRAPSTSSELSSPAVFLREVSSSISKTAESIKESIREYADEEEEDLPPTTTGDYVVPAQEPAVDAASASAQGEDEKDESNEATPQEQLPVDKGVASLPPPPPPLTSSNKKYKRPRLHKISKKLFGSSKRKSKKINLNDVDSTTMASI
jgi:hypothetical protein